MRARICLLILLCALSATQLCEAKVWIVDAGGGGDFTQIQAAIFAGADGDVILVQPGTYAPFTLSKGIIVRAAAGSFTVRSVAPSGTSPVTISGVGAGKRAGISGMTFAANSKTIFLAVLQCAGEVILERVTIDCLGGCTDDNAERAKIADCANVSIDGLVILPGAAPGCSQLYYSCKTVYVLNSTVRVTAAEIHGATGDNGVNEEFSNDGRQGSAGIAVVHSTLILARSRIQGGDGGDGVYCPYNCMYSNPYGNGGAGAPAVTTDVPLPPYGPSIIYVLGDENDCLAGGDGGLSAGSSQPWAGGAGLSAAEAGDLALVSRVALSGGTTGGAPFLGSVIFAPSLPFISMTEDLRSAALVEIEADSALEPGLALLVLSDAGGSIALPGFSGPPLSALPGAFFIFFSLGHTDAAGKAGAAFYLPNDPALLGFPLHAQPAVIADSGLWLMGNAAVRVIGP
ncbi:MAG: hypothetical protein HY812_09635 [Planctomycetes bacterium]|nr:hypothetical protein [Planctomycetota bacterium]